MEVSVKLSNLRTSPRKVRQVIDLVRGKKAVDAQSMLSFTVNKSARPVLKLLNSAVASAKHDFQLDEANLFISKITVDEGPKLKRWHPMSRGRAYPIIKRTSHVALTLSDGKAKEEKPDKKAKPILTGRSQSRPPARNAAHSAAGGKASLAGKEKPKTRKRTTIKK